MGKAFAPGATARHCPKGTSLKTCPYSNRRFGTNPAGNSYSSISVPAGLPSLPKDVLREALDKYVATR